MGGCLCDAESAPHRQCLRIQENYFLYTYANKSQNVSLYPNTNTHIQIRMRVCVCTSLCVGCACFVKIFADYARALSDRYHFATLVIINNCHTS